MKKPSKSKSSVPRVDPYLEGLMAKLLERLVGLERKLDVVVSQTAGRPSAGVEPSPKPFSNHEAKQPPRRERPLYEAICADCHKVCEVPFRPSENRPVYCKECFAKRKAGGSGPKFPVLTPVALPPKPVSRLGEARPPAPAQAASQKAKKAAPAKKTKKAKKK
ncbi:MAG TPA: CxxC-x17-CxxC domain-containing protein [Candidatus Eisenbacteria bacterium]|jgi:CxxC-x17-CxxC domain-containing protein|nr:CxxC-x17-CxxC domain-containing protein [Candidatus Eisenbacteria bacterium]